MPALRNHVLGFCLCGALGAAFADGCEKQETNPPGGGKKGSNLCTDYGTCDECIAGQQRKGISKGEAETQCGAAVIGCWTTWDKPIVCHGKKHDEPPAEK